MSSFKQVYRQLNTEQKRAVDVIDGPVMVMAGPGTGKTQVLSARIAHILQKTDTDPSSILALTFTQSATKNMRERLFAMIGRTAYYVQINTFHGFCEEVISSYPDVFTIDSQAQPVSDLDKYLILKDIILSLPLDKLKPINRPLFYLKEISHKLSELKREGVSQHNLTELLNQWQKELTANPDSLSQVKLEKQLLQHAKNRELVQIYERYQQALAKQNRYDFDDMISLVVEAFSHNQLLLRDYQEKLLYFLVDEFQDTNSAQNKVVDQLASYWGEKANLFVVGDPHQSIFRFQGASLENTLGFMKRYAQAELIKLDQGYRCSQAVYDLAAGLISQNNNANQKLSADLNQVLQSQVKHQTPIQLMMAPQQILESVWVAEEMTRLITQGVELSAIAVLYRNNADGLQIRETLGKWGIKYQVDGGQNLLEDNLINQLLNLLRLIQECQQGNDDLSYRVMSYDWLGLSPVLVMKVARAAHRAKLSMLDLADQPAQKLSQLQDLSQVSQLELTAIKQFVDQLAVWAGAANQQLFPSWFEVVLKESGYLEHIQSQDEVGHHLSNLNTLFTWIKSMVARNHNLSLSDFLDSIELMNEHRVRLSAQDQFLAAQAVQLSTVHKAKGREWDYVFVMGAVDGKWGNSRQRELIKLPPNLLKFTDLDKKEKNEDDRRLFYVAITRAKKQLTVSYPAQLVTETQTKDLTASMFVEELRSLAEGAQAGRLKQVDAAQLLADQEIYLEKLLSPPALISHAEQKRDYLAQLVADFKLSVTALNAYLKDPQEFLENYLLRVPRAKPEPMAFGTAVHAALEGWNKHLLTHDQHPSLESILSKYEQTLAQELLNSQDFTRRLKYGQQVLSEYYQHSLPVVTKPLFVERAFGYGWSKTMLGDIALTGRIDRVDWLDQAERIVRVIDYKTGKAKSENFIEGQTKSQNLSARELALPTSIRGPYKRQLLFYKLLTKLDKSFIPTASVGEFVFIEPNASGKLISRSFELKDEDVEQLKDLIKTVMKEIRELEFLE